MTEQHRKAKLLECADITENGQIVLQSLAKADADDSIKSSIGLRGAHWSKKALEEMTERDWRIFREDFDIRVKGGKAPLPLRSWEEGNLSPSIIRAIEDLKYKEPSPIWIS